MGDQTLKVCDGFEVACESFSEKVVKKLLKRLLAYHAYQSGTMTFTLGYWSIDTRTAEVWSDLFFEPLRDLLQSSSPSEGGWA